MEVMQLWVEYKLKRTVLKWDGLETIKISYERTYAFGIYLMWWYLLEHQKLFTNK